jgi:hypothetical protein
MPIPSNDILWSAVATIEQQILPAITEPLPRSLCYTLANLIRLVRVRLEREGQDLTDSIAEARSLLERSGHPKFAAVLAAEYRPHGAYPSPASLDKELDAMHRALDEVLLLSPEAGANLNLREEILEHLRAHHARVGSWIQAAFIGLRR